MEHYAKRQQAYCDGNYSQLQRRHTLLLLKMNTLMPVQITAILIPTKISEIFLDCVCENAGTTREAKNTNPKFPAISESRLSCALLSRTEPVIMSIVRFIRITVNDTTLL
ncbi:MAG: hypothetical protein Q8L37_06500 [Candidatus Gottesmanbacteria bacterium]|nr:hypothetical protein [Candidatus Gottesmanbacteria bacterium]